VISRIFFDPEYRSFGALNDPVTGPEGAVDNSRGRTPTDRGRRPTTLGPEGAVDPRRTLRPHPDPFHIKRPESAQGRNHQRRSQSGHGIPSIGRTVIDPVDPIVPGPLRGPCVGLPRRNRGLTPTAIILGPLRGPRVGLPRRNRGLTPTAIVLGPLRGRRLRAPRTRVQPTPDS
jgi:hypothetical protein